MQVNVHKNDLAKYTANAIAECLGNAQEKQILFLVSGGSALKVLEHLDPSVLGENVTVSCIDERYSIDPDVSNFLAIIKTHFYLIAQSRAVHFISSLPYEGESIHDVVMRWENSLRAWKEDHSQNSLVVALLGIGEDGHTAGIMPFPEDPEKFRELFVNTKDWIVGYDAGAKNKYPIRMTASLTFLTTMLDHTFVYVAGEHKRDIVKKVLATEQIAHFPASIIKKTKNIHLYTDISLK